MSGTKTIFTGVLVIGLVGVGFAVLATSLSFCGEAAEVAQEEFGPRAALEKYERFKDTAATLGKKRADIGVLAGKLTSIEKDYEGISKREWPRLDRQQYRQWQSELAGLKMSYNRLASEYNADMAKFNHRFANRGDLPAGATDPLPREFKPYVTE